MTKTWRMGWMAVWMVAVAGFVAGCQNAAETPAAAPAPAEAVVENKEAGVPNAQSNAVVVIETSKGTIKVELWADKAPITVSNFLAYVDEKFFDGLIFHRVMGNFMIQGGGFSPDMSQKATKAQIKNEASAKVPNKRGTLAMARTSVVDSATAQFFINLVDNDFLNHTDETQRGFGYCAFGKVIEGMDVVDAIAKVQTGDRGGHQNVPVEPVVMKTVRRSP